MSRQEGTAFILTNDAMPGFARFEFTLKDDLAGKIRKINKSDLPIPFRLYCASKVNDCELLDRTLHYLFSEYCDTRDSRFFRMNPDRLRTVIELAAIDMVELSDEEIGISPEMRSRMDQIKASHDASLFGAFSVPPGTTLYFSKDTTITCTALENGMVQYDGDVVAPGEATLRALATIGFDWTEASAADYWCRQSAGPAGNSRTETDSVVTNYEFEQIPIAQNGAGDSPVIFIKNEKR